MYQISETSFKRSDKLLELNLAVLDICDLIELLNGLFVELRADGHEKSLQLLFREGAVLVLVASVECFP